MRCANITELSVHGRPSNHMVAEYIIISYASLRSIVSQLIVMSRMRMHSAIMRNISGKYTECVLIDMFKPFLVYSLHDMHTLSTIHSSTIKFKKST